MDRHPVPLRDRTSPIVSHRTYLRNDFTELKVGRKLSLLLMALQLRQPTLQRRSSVRIERCLNPPNLSLGLE